MILFYHIYLKLENMIQILLKIAFEHNLLIEKQLLEFTDRDKIFFF